MVTPANEILGRITKHRPVPPHPPPALGIQAVLPPGSALADSQPRTLQLGEQASSSFNGPDVRYVHGQNMLPFLAASSLPPTPLLGACWEPRHLLSLSCFFS